MKAFRYKINGTQYRVDVLNEEENVVELEVNGTPYTVEVERKAKKEQVKVSRPAPAPVSATGT
ncbi:MAG: acetyl-CoA carboxylase biotin carboxyl carrier protein subunit, partial [Bacteroidales bacterium]|nr:acetyl-CoA carboxylase biotin carboxyl carrier protein subunit [Bacteroidales bacterium]MDD4713536.1 acetyl-CoA carboxylase biotin carboxyl carrier protein subunit [Bacteroidales bacterium]